MGRRAAFLDRDGVINRVRERDGLPYPPASQGEFEIYPEVPEEGVIRQPAKAFGRSIPQAGRAEGEPDRGRAADGRPRTHDDRNSAEVRDVTGGGFY